MAKHIVYISDLLLISDTDLSVSHGVNEIDITTWCQWNNSL